MLGLLNSFMSGPRSTLFRNSAGPIGVDLGSDMLRLAQVRFDEPLALIAAAARDVPAYAADEPAAYYEFVGDTLKELVREGGFVGRRAVIGLPSTRQHWLHLRLPKLDAQQTAAALKFECTGKLPFSPNDAVLRHHVIGDVYTKDGPRQEVLVTATHRGEIQSLLAVAERARLEVTGVVASPMALRDGFSRIYRRAADAETGFMFIDIGRCSSRVTILRGGHLYFARSINIGSDTLNAAAAEYLGMSADEARLLRARLSEGGNENTIPAEPMEEVESTPSSADDSFALLGAAERAGAARERAGGVATASREARVASTPAAQVWPAVLPVADALADEMNRCRRYHESTFPNVPVDRLVFVGGEANQRELCRHLAQRLGVAAQVGDLVSRLLPQTGECMTTEQIVAAGIDRRREQPDWAVACGLALGSRMAAPVGV